MIFSADIDPCAFASVATYLDKKRPRVQNRSETLARIVDIYYEALVRNGSLQPYDSFADYEDGDANFGWLITDPVQATEALEAFGFMPKSRRAVQSLADEIAESLTEEEQDEAGFAMEEAFQNNLDKFIAEIDGEEET